MTINWNRLRGGLAVVTLLLLTGSVHAQGVNQLVLSFDNPIQTGSIGDTLIFSGTAAYPVSNPQAAAPLPLNMDDLEIFGDGLTLNDFFDTNVPLALAGNQSVQTDFFSVTITPDALPGTYIGQYNIATSNPSIPPINFAVQVAGQAAVPEASPAIFLVVGLLPLACLARRRIAK